MACAPDDRARARASSYRGVVDVVCVPERRTCTSPRARGSASRRRSTCACAPEVLLRRGADVNAGRWLRWHSGVMTDNIAFPRLLIDYVAERDGLLRGIGSGGYYAWLASYRW